MFPKSKTHDFICYFLEKSFTLLGFDLKFPKGYFDVFTPKENIIQNLFEQIRKFPITLVISYIVDIS